VLEAPEVEHPDEVLRRRLRFRSWHRGTREADLLLGRFADAHLPHFDAAALQAYAALLEENDPDIYDWLIGRLPTPSAQDGVVMATLKAYYAHGYKP
jgi:antitoxin CptB